MSLDGRQEKLLDNEIVAYEQLDDEEAKIIQNVTDSFIYNQNSKSLVIQDTDNGDTKADKKQIAKELYKMGYSIKIINKFFRYFTTVQDLPTVVDMLTKENGFYNHLFIPSENQQECDICGEDIEVHIQKEIGDALDWNSYQLTVDRQSSDVLKRSEIKELVDKECPICGEKKEEFVAMPCGSHHELCEECLAMYLTQKINDGDVLKITCPSCDFVFDERFIAQHLNQNIIQKYEKFKENIKVNTNNKLKWCPRPGCGRFVRKGTTRKVVCTCGFEICFNCGMQMHEGNCRTYLDDEYRRWAKSHNIQKCPKCKMVIEKNEGCNHMTCGHCHYEFCWICGMHYTSGHFDDETFFGCPGKQFTETDYKFGKILCYNFLYFILCPLILMYKSVLFSIKSAECLESLDDCCCGCRYQCDCLAKIVRYSLQFLLIIIIGALAYAVLLVPIFLYYLYRMLFLLKRKCTM